MVLLVVPETWNDFGRIYRTVLTYVAFCGARSVEANQDRPIISEAKV